MTASTPFVPEDSRLEVVQDGEQAILRLISGGRPLEEILAAIARLAERAYPRLRASLLVRHGERLRHGAAPSLPRAYTDAVDGLPIGSSSGTCGVAAHSGRPVITEDIRHDPNWCGHRELASRHGIRSCWSQPILDSTGVVVGTFAFYGTEPGVPNEAETQMVERLADLASITIERARAAERQRLSATVFDNTSDAVMITGADGRIMEINQAFVAITGYRRDQVIGRSPRLLGGGEDPLRVYRDVWRAVARGPGHWQGEVLARHADGSELPLWTAVDGVRDADDTLTHLVAVMSDISDMKRSQQEIAYLAHHDPLTGLPNRRRLDALLERGLARARRGGSQLAVVFIDLDRFKDINDSLGHHAGDELLQQVCERLRSVFRAEDVLARISGDELVAVFHDITGIPGVARIVERLMQLLAVPFHAGGHSIRITASMGISVYPDDADSVAMLLRNADTAMYRAKESGRNTYAFYSRDMTRRVLDRMRLESALRESVENDHFDLAYQPQIDLATGRWRGVEALLRWHHPELGAVVPGRFIPIAEDTGVIHEIGSWALEQACRRLRRWQDAGLPVGMLAVNVAASQIERGGFSEMVREVLERTGIAPQDLELEVTEGSIMSGSERSASELQQLRGMGVGLAIDDFGTGYSSLAQLKRLPVQTLKIDQSFIRDIPDDPNDCAIAEAIIALARTLGLQVVAEGVETEAQAAFLMEQGCYRAQGFLYGKPSDMEGIEALIGGGGCARLGK
ncbi:bifunctional diguanylate cyclase/phosphodiesterase [Arhodomonas sp. SL1]|uniref:bifunctional diguanylate cyclase/phosphodiesterase n=1 Tax=Arhodomonas sp. SL1 TaxID=3425691 RepID=UPI003F8858AC